MKRQYGVYTSTRSKKPRLVPPYEPPKRSCSKFYVSGTDVRNYMLRDPLVDWLKFMTRKNGSPVHNNPFVGFIMQRGNDFERELISYINNNKTPVVSVGTTITPETCAKTIELMMAGTPLIHSAPFRNTKRQTKGIIDLLIRSDFLHCLVGENPLPEELARCKAPLLTGNYHYIVVDIKFSTLPLRADGIHLLNSGNYPAYKAQLWIYTQAIGDIQGYTQRYAYILGRRWNYISKGEPFSGMSCLDKLGVIDYDGVDSEYKQRTQDAIVWLKDIQKHGKTWSVSPPSRHELYPNMCIDSGEWNTEKKKIADQLGDITQIWYCGVKNRQIAMSHGIQSWRDKRCCSKTIGMNGTRASTVDQIIDINRQNIDKIRPKIIKNNRHDWKTATNEVFVDFETFCDIFAPFEDLPEQSRTDNIFMIGVYYSTGSGWAYKNFVIKEVTESEEYRIMDEFVHFIRQQNNPKMWFWHADQNMWSRAENRQMEIAVLEKNEGKADNIVDNWKLYDWHDLCHVFREEPIVVKNCFKFGLKEIASAMHKHGLISATLSSECHSGMDAAINAWKTYQTHPNPENSPIMNDIAEYNRYDVTVLQQILFYLRENHV